MFSDLYIWALDVALNHSVHIYLYKCNIIPTPAFQCPALLYTFPSGIQPFYQGEQLPQNAPQQQTQAPSIHPATQTEGLSFY